METLDKQTIFRKISSWGWRRLRGSTLPIAIVFLSKRYRMPITSIKMKQLDKSVELKKIFFYSVLLLFFFLSVPNNRIISVFLPIFLSCKNTKHRIGGVKG
jgi:hypothetical protein